MLRLISHGNNRITFCVVIKTLHKSNPLLVSNSPNSYDTREGKRLQHEQTCDLTAGHDCSTSKPIRAHRVSSLMDGSCDGFLWSSLVNIQSDTTGLCDDTKTLVSFTVCALSQRCNLTCWSHDILPTYWIIRASSESMTPTINTHRLRRSHNKTLKPPECIFLQEAIWTVSPDWTLYQRRRRWGERQDGGKGSVD